MQSFIELKYELLFFILLLLLFWILFTTFIIPGDIDEFILFIRIELIALRLNWRILFLNEK